MTGRPLPGVLVVTLWSNDGVPVARLRGYRGQDSRLREVGVFAGHDHIVDGVTRWLQDLEEPGGDPEPPDVVTGP